MRDYWIYKTQAGYFHFWGVLKTSFFPLPNFFLLFSVLCVSIPPFNGLFLPHNSREQKKIGKNNNPGNLIQITLFGVKISWKCYDSCLIQRQSFTDLITGLLLELKYGWHNFVSQERHHFSSFSDFIVTVYLRKLKKDQH